MSEPHVNRFDLDPDNPDEDLEDDEDDEDDDDDDGELEEEEIEDARRAAPATAPAPAREPVALVPSAAMAPAPGPAITDAPAIGRATFGRDPRSRFLPLSHPHVCQLAILHAGIRIAILKRPFPDPIERWVAATYGPGKYRVVERDDAGKHIGSRTVTVEGAVGARTVAFTEEPPPTVTNGHAPTQPPQTPAATVAAVAAALPPGTDWRVALITTGIPLIAGVITAGFQAIAQRPAPTDSLDQLAKVAQLLQVGNAERAEAFKEGLKMYRDAAAELPRGESVGGGELNVRDILSGVGEIVHAFRGSNSAAAPAAASVSPAPASAAGRVEAPAQLTDEQAGERYVEKLLVTEIQRAVGKGDTPECLVVLMDAYLPPLVVSYLENAPEAEVLAELPKRFPQHTEYLQGEQVQGFLRSALKMLREDAGIEEAAIVSSAGDAPPTG